MSHVHQSAHAALLREHGVQVTAQRLAVLSAVTDRPHGTADEITDAVRAAIGAISRQSVYNALTVLTERDIVRRIQPAGSAARFEPQTGDDHDHLVCRSCGRIDDVDRALGTAPRLDADADLGFEVDHTEVTFSGRCHDCRPGVTT